MGRKQRRRGVPYLAWMPYWTVGTMFGFSIAHYGDGPWQFAAFFALAAAGTPVAGVVSRWLNSDAGVEL